MSCSVMATAVPERWVSGVHLLLLLFCLCCFNRVTSAQPKLPDDEIYALRQIDAKLKIGWDFTADPCSGGWTNVVVVDNDNSTMRNVTCGDCDDANSTCHVTYILLKSQNLTGFLPPDFANLKSLVHLDLTRNYINGTIPPEWGSLPRLEQLDLGQNRISGSIPQEIGNITTLISITMENNLLQGPIPISLGNLKNLTRLIISGNDFTGELPESMGNLTNLHDFRIDGTGISGKIPDFIGNWTSLEKLYMQGTSLEGSFPSFSSLEKLSELRVSDLKGVGTFPSLENKQMKSLVMRNCSLSGALPNIDGEMSELKVLDLSFNNFTGEIPSSYSSLQAIKYIFLNNNSLTGAIPNWSQNTKTFIDISHNFFNESMGAGAPKDCFDENKITIASFSSSENSTINTCLRKNYPCNGKPTNYNLFINCGGSLVKVGDNEYESDSENNDGPHSFRSIGGKWAFSSTGDFFDNSKMAYIAKNQSTLNTSNPELYMNARLSPSSLIYYGICMQAGNYTVDLHFAEIMFIDGQTYYSVGRRFFDVYIQGQKVLENFNIVEAANGTGRSVVKRFNATVGDGALEIQFRWAGKGTTSVPEKGVYGPLISAISVTPNFKPVIPNSRKISTGAIVGIAVASCLLILIIVLILWFLKQRRYRRDDGLKGVHLQTSRFSLRQMKSATNNFDPANKIGEGGFGPVFKGVLPDGTLIAVKKLSKISRQGNREFINEIGLISSLQHPNLVNLYGCCVEEDQLLLVYEYMENNSLATVLFGEQKEKLKLDWRTRHNICLGVARGLTYLHEESRLKIVHRDIKANNVLLDKDLNAKISDFGLAKLSDDENTHMSTRIAGTRGYMAPEYATRGHLTDKADVYSFGIVLLEILSGKCHMIHMPDYKKIHLLDLAHNLEQNGRLHELVDTNLASDCSVAELVQIIKLALACTSKSPSNRPAMSTVVSMLESGESIQIQPVNQGLSNRQEPRDLFSIPDISDLSEDRTSKIPLTTTTGTYSQPSMDLNMDSYMECIPR